MIPKAEKYRRTIAATEATQWEMTPLIPGPKVPLTR